MQRREIDDIEARHRDALEHDHLRLGVEAGAADHRGDRGRGVPPVAPDTGGEDALEAQPRKDGPDDLHVAAVVAGERRVVDPDDVREAWSAGRHTRSLTCCRLCRARRSCCTARMRPSRHLSLSLALALGLASSLALGQGATAQPAPKAAAAPEKAAAPQKPAVNKPRGGSAGAPKRPGRARKPKKDAQASLAGRPVATFPGFRMLPAGGSRVFVQIHGGKVDVAESKAAGRLVYRLKGAGAIQTNRFPLVTSFFATPVTQVQLVGQGNDLDMVIDLRTQTDAAYRVLETDQGMVLQVDFPRPSPSSAPRRQPRGRASARSAARSRRSPGATTRARISRAPARRGRGLGSSSRRSRAPARSCGAPSAPLGRRRGTLPGTASRPGHRPLIERGRRSRSPCRFCCPAKPQVTGVAKNGVLARKN